MDQTKLFFIDRFSKTVSQSSIYSATEYLVTSLAIKGGFAREPMFLAYHI